MAYPSIISSFINPNPSDSLNNPSHSSIETAQNTALLEVMRAVGTDASTIGTVIGDLRNSNSNGGGHVQTANKGGTGQTSYAKGDILVASSSSVLSKLTVGANNTLLSADSSQSSGLKWRTGLAAYGLIASSTLTGFSSTLAISGIGSGFKKLKISGNVYVTNGTNALRLRVNGDSGANYNYQYLDIDSTTVTAASIRSATGVILVNSVLGTVGTFEGFINNGPIGAVDIGGTGQYAGNGSALNQRFTSFQWAPSNASIASISLDLTASAAFQAGSQIIVEGSTE